MIGIEPDFKIIKRLNNLKEKINNNLNEKEKTINSYKI